MSLVFAKKNWVGLLDRFAGGHCPAWVGRLAANFFSAKTKLTIFGLFALPVKAEPFGRKTALTGKANRPVFQNQRLLKEC